MNNKTTKRRKIAILLLFIISLNTLMPSVAYALTSGPAQPETKGFQPAGVSDMVDLQSGDFKYNIPLLDIDGYPINLNYASGVGVDDEASWVGLGWSLNPGAINRQVRGLPDDFSGDKVETDQWTKPKVTVGGRLTAKVELFGNTPTPVSGSLTYGVYSDNYTGIGAELGVNAGISIMEPNDGTGVAGLGFGVLSDTQSGVGGSASFNMPIGQKVKDDLLENQEFGTSVGFNTRSGLKSSTLGVSFDIKPAGIVVDGDFGATITYNTEPISPKTQFAYQTSNNSYSIELGPTGFGVFGGTGLTGYKNVRQVLSEQQINPGYGFLYAERGKKNPEALMDFIRENENPIIPNIPNLAVPIQLPDLFSYTSQSGSGQFRLYRGGTGIFFDNKVQDRYDNSSLGGDIGLGAGVHAGVTFHNQTCTTTTSKWANDNDYKTNGDFQDASTVNPNAQHVFFRPVGEKNQVDQAMLAAIGGTAPVEVSIAGKSALSSFRTPANFYTSVTAVGSTIKKTNRQLNRTVISYLTAQEATVAGLDKKIINYQINDIATFDPTAIPLPTQLNRVDAAPPSVPDYTSPPGTDPISEPDGEQIRKPHHISEISVTDDGGKRMVYGIPVYNLQQDEYSFTVGSAGYTVVNKNQVSVANSSSPGKIPHIGTGSVDDYYHKETKPPYATSYLLTAILSPDYVDKTGNGITDDDLGTAIKFNYSRLTDHYKWRTPYQESTLNKGLLADPDDDKASIIRGKKEIWYVHSIESKTKIAFFITQERRDALGAKDGSVTDNDWTHGGANPDDKQRCLKEIRLYSKADLTKPIKVVKFDYSYQLCPGIPNSLDFGSAITGDPIHSGGKLTLTKVWFEYGNIDKGKFHPYKFSYNTDANGSTPAYDNLIIDRWGVYKNSSENLLNLENDEFPYSNQTKSVVDQNAALWHLSKIDLPTGGTINISYESDDYAYVQNRKAMVMSKVEAEAIRDPNSNDIAVRYPSAPLDPMSDDTYLRDAQALRVAINTSPPTGADPTAWFKKNYLDGSDYIYTKFRVKLSTTNDAEVGDLFDFVPCYARIDKVMIGGGYAYLEMHSLSTGNVTVNPIIMAAWQHMKNEYPRYAYPGFENVRHGSVGSSLMGAISATLNAAENLSELLKNFYQKAYKNGYAARVQLDKSFVRLTKNNGPKLGGGVRVKKIQIADNWRTLSGQDDATAGAYGQAYNYTTIENNLPISSGVATYEPSNGNDENPFKQPVEYQQASPGALTNYLHIEEPFAESLFPAPSVTYSKVTVTDLDQSGEADPQKNTGTVVNEFYTSKDFPVKVNVLPIYPIPNKPQQYFSLVKTTSDDELCMSQGYSIELNDMNGKARAVRVLDKSGSEISSTSYNYNIDGATGGLSNLVTAVSNTGAVQPLTRMGQDVEFFTDFREQESSNTGFNVNLGFDILGVGPFGWFQPHFPIGVNDDYKLFRSTCALKVIQSYGILGSVVKRQNGSSITTQNIAFDALTGDPVVTSTQNEFNNNIYSVNMPAYWAYKRMGGAYQNLGVVLSGLTTNSSGENSYSAYLQPGDELDDVTVTNTTPKRYWIIASPGTGSANTQKLVDVNGIIQPSITVGLAKVVRSGFRNVLSASAGSIVSLNNPIKDGYLQIRSGEELTSTLKAINASATTYDESWAVNKECITAGTPIYSVRDIHAYVPFVSGGFSGLNPWGTIVQPSSGSISTTTYQSPFWGGANCSTASIRTTSSSTDLSLYQCGPIVRSMVSLSSILPPGDTFNEAFGFETCLNTDPTKTYYLGYWGSGILTIDLDGSTIVSLNQFGAYGTTDPNSLDYWRVIPINLSSGSNHILKVQNYNDEGSGYLGVEIYQNTADEITHADATGSNIHTVFTTASLVGRGDIQSFYVGYLDGIYYYHYTNPGTTTPSASCPTYAPYTPLVVNPYVQGYLGNWRPYQTKVYQQSRAYNNIFDATNNKMDIANAGYINNLYSFWNYGAEPDGQPGWVPNTNSGAARWVTANTVTLYDKYGQQLENKDALGRFSAAKFDFNGELPAAVASNAMNREIYASSFEDNTFITDMVGCQAREFVNAGTGVSVQKMAHNTTAHSGNYSAQLTSDGIIMSTIVHSAIQKTVNYLTFDSSNQYTTQNIVGLYPNGFEPSPGKKYIFNAWVKDGDITEKSVSSRLSFSVNGINVPIACKAMVEDWKLVEATIDLTAIASGATLDILLKPISGATVVVDDIRMHPFDAHMKTYAYDDKTMRLMAELDENGFATFYEYDNEGLLVRVKKETERGIITLKESRSSYKQIN
jgi:hypothetical protein